MDKDPSFRQESWCARAAPRPVGVVAHSRLSWSRWLYSGPPICRARTSPSTLLLVLNLHCSTAGVPVRRLSDREELPGPRHAGTAAVGLRRGHLGACRRCGDRRRSGRRRPQHHDLQLLRVAVRPMSPRRCGLFRCGRGGPCTRRSCGCRSPMCSPAVQWRWSRCRRWRVGYRPSSSRSRGGTPVRQVVLILRHGHVHSHRHTAACDPTADPCPPSCTGTPWP